MTTYTGKKYPHGAIFIGVNQYGKPSGLDELRYAYADAKALYELFIQKGYPRECCLLLPEQAQSPVMRWMINDPIEQLIQRLEDDATLFIYFSGHGVEPGGKEHFLLFHDAQNNGSSWNGSLTVKAIKNWAKHPYGNLAESRSEHSNIKVILVLDACRSDLEGQRSAGAKSPALASYNAVKKSHIGNTDVNPFIIIESCSGSQCAFEVKGSAHGVFTSALLKILDKGLFQSIGDVFSQLKNANLGEQQPEICSNVHLNEVMLFGEYCPVPQNDLVAFTHSQERDFGAFYIKLSAAYPNLSTNSVRHALLPIDEARTFIKTTIEENTDFSDQLAFYNTLERQLRRKFTQIQFDDPEQKPLWLAYANALWTKTKARPRRAQKAKASPPPAPQAVAEAPTASKTKLRERLLLQPLPVVVALSSFFILLNDSAWAKECTTSTEFYLTSLATAAILYFPAVLFTWILRKLMPKKHLPVQIVLAIFSTLFLSLGSEETVPVEPEPATAEQVVEEPVKTQPVEEEEKPKVEEKTVEETKDEVTIEEVKEEAPVEGTTKPVKEETVVTVTEPLTIKVEPVEPVAEVSEAEALYAQGMQYAKDAQYTEAFPYYLKAAQLSHTEAQYQLANCYFYARGTKRDKAEAIKWYNRAAKKKHAGAIRAVNRSHESHF